MNNIESASIKSSFFPKHRKPGSKIKGRDTLKIGEKALERNDLERIKELEESTEDDVKVKIASGVKDFAKIKKVVDSVADKDNSAKIANLKAQIKNRTYKVDYEELADKILAEL
ncbi:MAG: flagellar biosynthesis anti-sigma factor FlgM [Bacteriovoracaceae bacterium]|nr:flagellar biosynthesis anti-sigma factor FlgM [Bacteriovoracaceae bacterium]